jgi:hypothetical protein
MQPRLLWSTKSIDVRYTHLHHILSIGRYQPWYYHKYFEEMTCMGEALTLLRYKYSDTLYIFFVKVATVFKRKGSWFIWIMKHVVKILVLTNFLLQSSMKTQIAKSNGRNPKSCIVIMFSGKMSRKLVPSWSPSKVALVIGAILKC